MMRNEIDKEITFSVYVDMKRVREAMTKMKEMRENDSVMEYAEKLAGRKILLVEDHPINLKIAKLLLENAGCVVETADNGLKGVQAFEISKAYEYDAILMDIRMPVMDGLEASRAIRSMTRSDAPTVPIIAMTANIFDDEVNSCIAAGMNSHIAKPFETNEFYEELVKHISIK